MIATIISFTKSCIMYILLSKAQAPFFTGICLLELLRIYAVIASSQNNEIFKL